MGRGSGFFFSKESPDKTKSNDSVKPEASMILSVKIPAALVRLMYSFLFSDKLLTNEGLNQVRNEY